MNVLTYAFPKLAFFGDNRAKMLMYLVSPNFIRASDYVKGAISKMISLIDINTSEYELETIVRCVENLTLYNVEPTVFIVNQGEDFEFEVTLEPGKSFAGYTLRAYNAQTGLPLGPGVPGNSDLIQQAPVLDLDLTEGHTYRAHVVLLTTEPSSILITEAFLVVEGNIDYQEMLVILPDA